MPVETDSIPVADCRASAAARDVKPIQVELLAKSIEQIGLIQPIVVRPVAGGYEVIAGMHRLSAFRLLGRPEIPAIIRSDDDLHAELALIDENLIRNELSPAERALAISRRKAIYEALHPETAHGAIGGGHDQSRQLGDSAKAERFTKATADSTGVSERTVQREAQRGEDIGEAALSKVAGTSLDKGEELDALAKLSPQRRDELIEKAAAGEKVSAKVEAKKERRTEREAELADKQRALPEKKYGVIYADPEWRFEVYSRETGMDRAADNHYPTSVTDEICKRPVGDIAADDCVLFLWATVPMLPDALRVMEAWGFEYKSHAIWVKDRAGTGYWFRNYHELLLVGTKGNVPAPAMGTQWRSAQGPIAVRAHSEKPDDFMMMIEQYFPSLPKIELNARRARPGWDAWGNEAPSVDYPANEHVTCESPSHVQDTGTSDECEADPRQSASPAAVPAHPLLNPPAGTAATSPVDDEALDIPAFLRRGDPACAVKSVPVPVVASASPSNASANGMTE